MDGWKSCDGCPNTQVERSEMVMPADRWDSLKRSTDAATLAYELQHAKQKGKWVKIEYQWKSCKFDNQAVIPTGIFHNCPWHGKELKVSKEWWE